ncbi:hypothetical protein ABPG75_003608 [Micractinium tetrahymenae]
MDMESFDKDDGALFKKKLPSDVWLSMMKYLTAMIGKKPNRAGVPYQIDFYSFKSGRIRFKWTTKKTWEQVWPYFKKGSYNGTACQANGVFEYRYATNDCKGGPFSPAIRPGTSPPMSFFAKTIEELENVIDSGWKYGSTYKLGVRKIVISNGYLKPPAACEMASSGPKACYKHVSFPE